MDTYVECLVKAKQSGVGKFFKMLLTMLTVMFVIMMFMGGGPVALIVAAITGIGAYFVNLNTDLEYEYLYVDKELSIDKVMAKTKRKRIGTYQVDRMEICAPFNSYHLDDYRKRNAKEKDYSIGEELKPDRRYIIYYEGGEKLILSPNEELIKALKNVAPRKVFTD